MYVAISNVIHHRRHNASLCNNTSGSICWGNKNIFKVYQTITNGISKLNHLLKVIGILQIKSNYHWIAPLLRDHHLTIITTLYSSAQQLWLFVTKMVCLHGLACLYMLATHWLNVTYVVYSAKSLIHTVNTHNKILLRIRFSSKILNLNLGLAISRDHNIAILWTLGWLHGL